MAEAYGIIYEDEDWVLERSSLTPAHLEYWLHHDCYEGKAMVNRYLDEGSCNGEFDDNLEQPCAWCGSVAPEALKGLYLLMRWER